MVNFQQIAEDCLAGKLSGTFVLRNGKVFHSQTHLKATISYVYPYYIAGLCYSVEGNCYSSGLSESENDIIDFIPDMKKEQIIIDIPDGMGAVQETVDGEIRIKFVEKKLTYIDIYKSLYTSDLEIQDHGINVTSKNFYKKVEVLRKLINIRNYFGKPEKYDRGYCIEYSRCEDRLYVGNVNTIGVWVCDILFKEKEYAEEAIRILGDELKYLFEPW